MVNCADCVSSVGLILDIVGVGIIFVYGLSADVRETGGQIISWPGGKGDEEAKGQYRRYKRISRIGLGCLIVGFALQLISNFLS